MNFRNPFSRYQRERQRGFQNMTWEKYQAERLKAIVEAQDARRDSTLHWYVSVDLGKAQDPSAIVIGTHVGPSQAYNTKIRLENLMRWKLGTNYDKIIKDIISILQRPVFQEENITITLVIDATGVGAPVVDMLRAASFDDGPWKGIPLVQKVRFFAVYITPGKQWRAEGWRYFVPKMDIVESAQVALQNGNLTFPPEELVPEVEELKKELMRFQFKKTANQGMTAEAWRESDHDDLVLATGQLCFAAGLRTRGKRRWLPKSF